MIFEKAEWELDRHCLVLTLVVDGEPIGQVLGYDRSWHAYAVPAQAAWQRSVSLDEADGPHWTVQPSDRIRVGEGYSSVKAALAYLEDHVGVGATRESLTRCAENGRHLWARFGTVVTDPRTRQLTYRSSCVWCEAIKTETFTRRTFEAVSSEIELPAVEG